MSKRIAVESRIVEFFTNAPFERADVVFSIVSPIIKLRRYAETVPAAVGPEKPRRKPRKKRQAELPLAEVAS